MRLGSLSMEWVTSFKYLGITFNNNGSKINIDCHVLKRKFYSASNSVFSHCRNNDDLVKLHLVKSFCLPLLTYCLGAIAVPRYRIKEMGVCWNDSFRKIFGFHRWESVKELQWYLGELPFEYIYDLYRWKFLCNKVNISESSAILMDISNLQYGYISQLTSVYGNKVLNDIDVDISNINKKQCVYDTFDSNFN